MRYYYIFQKLTNISDQIEGMGVGDEMYCLMYYNLPGLSVAVAE